MNNLKKYFKNTKILKQTENDTVLCDAEFEPHCGYMSFLEIEILQKYADTVKGIWLEIGSHTGWSGAHVAEKCDKIYMVDPQYCVENFKNRTIKNLKNCNVYDKCILFPTDCFFDTNKQTFDGIIIDGNHDAPYPLLDAINADKVLNKNGIIMLHDYNGSPIQDAVKYLKNNNYTITIYNTINGLAFCRKGT